MRFALLAMLLGALVLVALLIVPPPSFESLPGGAPPAAGFRLCLALRYDPPGSTLPSRVGLFDTLDAAVRADTVYRARVPKLPGRYPTRAAWRPSGPDSLDLFFKETLVLRLPRGRGTLIGRALYPWQVNLLRALLGPDYVVRATEFPCGHLYQPAV